MTREVVEYLAEWLVDNPGDIVVEEVEGDGRTQVVEISVHPDDIGKVIGKRGRIIRAVRTLAKAAGQRDGRNIAVEVID